MQYSVQLPVIPRSLGNMITLNFATKDNYSAGDSTVVINGDNDVKGRWQADTPYTNYYGRAWWAQFELLQGNLGENKSAEEIIQFAHDTPNLYSQTNISLPLHRLRKDNRETLSYNVELEIKTDNLDIIIGSALAFLNGWVNAERNAAPVAYVYDLESGRIGKFDHVFDPSKFRCAPTLYEIEEYDDGSFTLSVKADNISGWVICTPISNVTEEVEDEDGNVETITYQTGGEILLASNKPLPTDTEYFYLDFYVVKN